MSVKTIGLVVTVVGVLGTLFFATGHLIGILNAGFGPRQLAGTLIGAVILVVGIVLCILASRKEKAKAEPKAG